MNNKVKHIVVVAGMIVFALIATIGVYMYDTAFKNEDVVTADSFYMLNSKFTDYEGQTIEGTTVRALLDDYSDDNVAVEVITNKGDFWYYYTDKTLQIKSNLNIASSLNKNNENYINPGANYFVSLSKDENGNIVVVTFTQVEELNW